MERIGIKCNTEILVIKALNYLKSNNYTALRAATARDGAEDYICYLI